MVHFYMTVFSNVSNPAICNTTSYVKDNGSFACGFYLGRSKSWSQANTECMLKGARLPEIASAQENKDIFDRMVLDVLSLP